MSDVSIRLLAAEDIPAIMTAFAALGWERPVERYLEEQRQGKREVLVAWQGNAFAGYVTVLWQSYYTPFRDAGIPEINDLSVPRHLRRQGIGSRLLDKAERRTAEAMHVLDIHPTISFSPHSQWYNPQLKRLDAIHPADTTSTEGSIVQQKGDTPGTAAGARTRAQQHSSTGNGAAGPATPATAAGGTAAGTTPARRSRLVPAAAAKTKNGGATRTGRGRVAATKPARAAVREPHKDLLRYRDEFPILARKTYLNSCSLGALSDRAMAGMARFQELWNEHGAQAWYRLWMTEIAAVREKVARIIGAHPHEIAIAPNVSIALSEITSGLDLGARNKVVVADMDFPTLAYQWLAKRGLGIEVDFVASEDRITLPAERFAAHLDARTGLVATSRVFFMSGYIQNVGRLARMAHEHGAYLLVDDYQATGQIPIDVHALDIDFLVTGTLKWLMGGPGLAFIYVREDLIPKLHPTVAGWFSARDQFAMRATDFEYKEGAQRFEAGTPAVAPIYAASGALDMILEIGVERIRERSMFLSDDLIRRVQAKGWPIQSPLDGRERSSIVMLRLEHPDEIVAALSERDIIVDHRPGLVRVSPYFYNTVEENQIIVDAIDDILRSRGAGKGA